jgi:hypothetical protein
MARRINVSNEGRFVPEWEGNRDLPEEDQLYVEYTCLTHDERKKYVHFEKPSYSIEIEGKSEEEIEEQIQQQTKKIEYKAWTDNDKIAVAMKPRIGNFEDMDGNPIDTWAKLLAVPQTKENQVGALVLEIETELGTLAKEKDSKN